MIWFAAGMVKVERAALAKIRKAEVVTGDGEFKAVEKEIKVQRI